MKIVNSLILICLAWLMMACQTETISGLQGKVKRDALTVVSKYPGRIVDIYVNEGEHVVAGDTLMLLNMPEVEAKMAQASGAVAAAKAQYEMAMEGATNEQLRQVSAKLDAVKEQYQFAEKSYERINNMYVDSLVSDQKHDEVYMKYQGAKAQYEGVLAKYEEVKNGVRDEKVRMALGSYERAKGALEEAQVAYNERYLLAPQKMTIETIALHKGELVLPGYGVVTGYQLNQSYFRFTVAESKVSDYQVGNAVKVESPFANKTIDAKVVAIKQLTRYAQITSAFPEYELGEAIYELKLVPVNNEEVSDWLTNITVIIK